MSKQLVKYDAMCRAIDAACSIDEVKDIRDEAIRLEMYARQAMNFEAEQKAARLRIQAEQKAGKMLKVMENARGNQHKPARSSGATEHPPTLKELGISKDQSAQWQKLAAVPQREFDRALKEAERPTTSGILRATAPPSPVPTSDRGPVLPEALWLWGRLRDFERDGYLEAEPATILESMTEEMLDDVHTLAPRVAAWLRKVGAING